MGERVKVVREGGRERDLGGVARSGGRGVVCPLEGMGDGCGRHLPYRFHIGRRERRPEVLRGSRGGGVNRSLGVRAISDHPALSVLSLVCLSGEGLLWGLWAVACVGVAQVVASR